MQNVNDHLTEMCTLQWRHLSYQKLDGLLIAFFMLDAQETWIVTLFVFCWENPLEVGGFPSRRVSNTESTSMAWRPRGVLMCGGGGVAPEDLWFKDNEMLTRGNP